MKVTVLNITNVCLFLMLMYPAVCLGGTAPFTTAHSGSKIEQLVNWRDLM